MVCPDFTTTNPFNDLTPGTYILQVALNQDANCFMQYPFVLANQTGRSLDVSGVQIVSTTCSRSNGAISGIIYQNATGTVYAGWEDSSGHAIASGPNLVNVPAGLYRLAFKDGGPCDSIFTNWYRISDLGPISAVNIKVFDSVRLYVPNAFTPNNDGVNDRWHIILQGLVRNIRISVFDRAPAAPRRADQCKLITRVIIHFPSTWCQIRTKRPGW